MKDVEAAVQEQNAAQEMADSPDVRLLPVAAHSDDQREGAIHAVYE
jgi:hypothetical protein